MKNPKNLILDIFEHPPINRSLCGVVIRPQISLITIKPRNTLKNGLNLIGLKSRPNINCVGMFYKSRTNSTTEDDCFMCQPYYFFRTNTQNPDDPKTCRRPSNKNFTQRCLVGRILEDPTTQTATEVCYACLDGIPSPDLSECYQFSKDYEKIMKEKIKFDNCKLGVRVSPNATALCGFCQDRTFWVIGDRDDQAFGQCQRMQQDNIGCAKVVGGSCEWCNYYNGYFMVKPGICESSGKVLRVFLSGLVVGLVLISGLFGGGEWGDGAFL